MYAYAIGVEQGVEIRVFLFRCLRACQSLSIPLACETNEALAVKSKTLEEEQRMGLSPLVAARTVTVLN